MSDDNPLYMGRMSSARVSGLRWDPDTPPSPALSAVNRHAPAETDVIVGESDSLRYVMSRIEKVAATDATVLLTGETGTGKELLARDIHRQSPRRDRAFVVVNCAAVPPGLLESELFGRERGAFTGAHVSQAGRFELANRGTLFLDEIGELSLELQPKLLRALQNGGIERLGSTRTIDLDVRIIAATNRDLGEEARERRFRADLFYRLNVFPITVPSLRDRREDIPLLVRHMLERYSRVLRKTVDEVPPAVMQVLEAYDWPGNIRELENVIQRAIILSTSRTLELQEAWLPGEPSPATAPATSLSEVERRHMLSVLEQCRWKIEGPNGAARLLGLRPSTLRTRLRKRGLVRPG